MTSLIDLTGSPASVPTAATAATASAAAPVPSAARRTSRPSVPRTVPLSSTFRPPIIEGESQPEWDSHLRGVNESYAPEGYVEEACLFRIASLLWRLNRLAHAEVDELSRSIAEAERDAAATVAASATEPAHIKPILPADVAGLRACTKDAALAAGVLAEFHTLPSHDPVLDEHVRVAHYFLAAFYSHSPHNPPPEPPPAGWDGTRVRSALTKLAVNRSLYDDLAAATQFARDVCTAAERRLAEIKILTARLRHERRVPQSALALHIRESEASLSAQLDQAIHQLDLLQAGCAR